jgi:hypothetical protein
MICGRKINRAVLARLLSSFIAADMLIISASFTGLIVYRVMAVFKVMLMFIVQKCDQWPLSYGSTG